MDRLVIELTPLVWHVARANGLDRVSPRTSSRRCDSPCSASSTSCAIPRLRLVDHHDPACGHPPPRLPYTARAVVGRAGRIHVEYSSGARRRSRREAILRAIQDETTAVGAGSPLSARDLSLAQVSMPDRVAHRWPITDGWHANVVDQECMSIVADGEDPAVWLGSLQREWLARWRARDPQAAPPHYWSGLQIIGRSIPNRPHFPARERYSRYCRRTVSGVGICPDFG